MNKTADIEEALHMTLRDTPDTLEGLEKRLLTGYPQLRGLERTWIGIAVHKMIRDGRMVTVGCSASHNHEGYCKVKVGRR